MSASDGKKAAKAKTYWMHTIHGKPAGFDGRQICYWWKRAPLAGSLSQIRRERKACIAFRESNGFVVDPQAYGHITVTLP